MKEGEDESKRTEVCKDEVQVKTSDVDTPSRKFQGIGVRVEHTRLQTHT